MYMFFAITAGVGIIAAIIAFADLYYRLRDGERITIVGQVVCLPHKQGLFDGVNTDECAIGFENSDGRHFAFKNIEQLAKQGPELIGSEQTRRQFQISGQFSYGADEQYQIYDVAGMIQVDSVRAVPLLSEVSSPQGFSSSV